jgi:hypothetical protein
MRTKGTGLADRWVFGLAAAALLIMLAVPLAAHASVVITIDKSAQSMTVVVDGQQRWVWPVSTGRRGYATPEGSYKAFRMEEDHYSKEWDEAPMPHSIFFTKKGHAIHGTFETRRLGTPASHGCVRLSTPNAAALFALVRERGVINTQVVVTGSEDFRHVAEPRRARPRERSAQQRERRAYPREYPVYEQRREYPPYEYTPPPWAPPPWGYRYY